MKRYEPGVPWQLERARLYSEDERGERVKPAQPGHRRVRETRCYNVQSDASPHREQLEARLSSLTVDEREVMRLQGKVTSHETVRERVPAGDVREWFDRGYVLVAGSEREEERKGLPTITTVEVEGVEALALKLSLVEISERMGKSSDQIRRLVTSANKKLRGAQ